MDLKDELQKIIKGEISTEEAELVAYSTDASLFKVRPSLVLFPKDAQDVKNAVRFVSENKHNHPELSISARSAGSGMSGGSLSESIVMAFTKHMREFSVDKVSKTALTQPGVYYRDFEKETLKYDLLLPSYPASKSIAGMGGIINNNAGGEITTRYGKTERYVNKVKMVLRDGNEYIFGKIGKRELEEKMSQNDFEGEIYRKMYELLQNNYEIIKKSKPNVTKNSAGYKLWDVWDKDSEEFDMAQIFIGAQGTLGIMTEAELRLITPKPHRKMLVLFLSGIEQIPEIVNAILPLDPESLETFDDETLKLALRFFPSIAKKIPGENLISFLFKFIPEGLITLQMLGLPKIIILAQFAEDSEQEAERKITEAEHRVSKFKLKKRVLHNDRDSEKYRVIRRESFNLLREHVSGKRTAPFVDDFIVKPEYLPEVLPKVYKILEEYGIHKTIAGHVGSGNFHIIPLMDLSKDEEKNKIPEVSEKIYDVVLKYNGSITAEHNDGLIRSPYLEKMFGKEVYNLFKEVKNIFDPDNIFNPGKKVGASMEYAMKHIDHK